MEKCPSMLTLPESRRVIWEAHSGLHLCHARQTPRTTPTKLMLQVRSVCSCHQACRSRVITVVRATLDQLDLFNRLSKLYPKYFTPSASEADAQAAFLAGRLISPVAIEGLHQIGNSAGTLRLYHQLGVRYATLTWNCHNVFADAALTYENREISVAKPLWHGVSKRGRALIHEMNRLGMLVDLSHVSTDTMRDVLYGNRDLDAEPSWEGSFAPPIFSHSSAYAICPHPRNVPDDVLKLVRNRGGLVMVNISPDFISCRTDPKSKNGLPLFVNETNTLDHMVDHIMHIGELIGYDWVGIGTDFDGIESTPRGLEGVERFPQLVAQMLRRGVSEQDAAKVVGRNLLRVWAKADQVSRDMKAKGWEPLEDELSRGWWEEGQAI